MANADVIANESPVEIAWRQIYGPVAEAQSLIGLYRTCEDNESWACLARGVLERLCDAIEAVNDAERVHGRPPAGEVQHA